ncbi:hypothetical protein [Undibacterium fentianense]|uniref:Uncharacterized protein n=1 Tax=Undibacterium fentianense TaxID=2828728 RepID=A0A941E525_9BURK|nr:hypothetical protein [Undibacterium fentianense]MBR7801711.1 hypothetical protein [Undibacterium fentianense]
MSMLPLQFSRILDYQQPAIETHRSRPARNETEAGSDANTKITYAEERRLQNDRRHNDRREKQHATFLNTRKVQGRRKSAGRRAGDLHYAYTPISLKG